jgi:hypothetical protein
MKEGRGETNKEHKKDALTDEQKRMIRERTREVASLFKG